jgi:hypothetical protein
MNKLAMARSAAVIGLGLFASTGAIGKMPTSLIWRKAVSVGYWIFVRWVDGVKSKE